jgi:hypothetical protein
MKRAGMRVGVMTVMLTVWLGIRVPLIAEPMVVGWIDFPSDGTVVSRNGFYAAGWVFRCDTGGFPDSISVAFFNRDTQQWYFPSWWVLNKYVPRPDVRAAVAGACPNVTDYQGYHVYPVPPPPGHWDMYVSWATYDGGQWTERRQLTIVE